MVFLRGVQLCGKSLPEYLDSINPSDDGLVDTVPVDAHNKFQLNIDDNKSILVYGDLLINEGFHSSGNEIMYNGMTGVQMETDIFMTPIYYMRLKQLVHDKNQSRATGPRNNMTHQATSGRAHGGGLRVGEMERDAVLGHGAAGFLQESFMVRGDGYKYQIDRSSGLTSAKKAHNDDEIIHPTQQAIQKSLGSIDNVAARKLTTIETPYALKLLFQELQTMSIAPRIILQDDTIH